MHGELRILPADAIEIRGQFRSIFRSKPFSRLFVALRRVDADPDIAHLRTIVPERKIAIHIPGLLDVLTNNGPVDIDAPARDIFENALVRGGLAADVVIFGVVIDRHGDGNFGEIRPGDWKRDHAARNDQCVDASAAQLGNNLAQFAMPHERLSADERNLQRLVLIDQTKDSAYQIAAAVVANAAQVRTAFS